MCDARSLPVDARPFHRGPRASPEPRAHAEVASTQDAVGGRAQRDRADRLPGRAGYRHDDVRIRTVNVTPGERLNGHAHCRALLLGASACINVIGGALQLGRWQRVFLAELDGPRDRDISVLMLGESEP